MTHKIAPLLACSGFWGCCTGQPGLCQPSREQRMSGLHQQQHTAPRAGGDTDCVAELSLVVTRCDDWLEHGWSCKGVLVIRITATALLTCCIESWS